MQEMNDLELTKKVKIYRNSHLFLILVWIIIFAIFYFTPPPTCENNNEGPSLHGCGTTLSVAIAGIIALTIFIPSIISGLRGIELLKILKKRQQKSLGLIQITSYLLLIPLSLLIVRAIIYSFK